MSEIKTNLPLILKASQQSQPQQTTLTPDGRSFPRENNPAQFKDSFIRSPNLAEGKTMRTNPRNLKRTNKDIEGKKSQLLERSSAKKRLLTQDYESYEVQNRKQIQDRMQAIHKKINHQIINVGGTEEGQKFKLFREIIQTKKDIDRISRERRFIRSQNSRHLPYQEPKMQIPNSRPFKEYKLYTEIYEPDSLSLQAKEFSSRIHKQQEQLLGRCMLRKQREEKRRQLQYQRQIARKKLERQIMIGETRKYRYKDPLFANSRVINAGASDGEFPPKNQRAQEKNDSLQFANISGPGVHSLKLDKKYSQKVTSDRSEQAPADLKTISVHKLKSSSRTANLLPIEDQFLKHPLSIQIKPSKARIASNSQRE